MLRVPSFCTLRRSKSSGARKCIGGARKKLSFERERRGRRSEAGTFQWAGVSAAWIFSEDVFMVWQDAVKHRAHVIASACLRQQGVHRLSAKGQRDSAQNKKNELPCQVPNGPGSAARSPLRSS